MKQIKNMLFQKFILSTQRIHAEYRLSLAKRANDSSIDEITFRGHGHDRNSDDQPNR